MKIQLYKNEKRHLNELIELLKKINGELDKMTLILCYFRKQTVIYYSIKQYTKDQSQEPTVFISPRTYLEMKETLKKFVSNISQIKQDSSIKILNNKIDLIKSKSVIV